MNQPRQKYDNVKELRIKRKALIQDAIRCNKKPERIPVLSQAWTWKFLDAGYSIRDCLYDYDKCFDAVCEHHEKYEMDLYIDYGARNPLQVTDCYGPSHYIINDETNCMSIKDCNLMDADDYDTFIEDGPMKYFFERAVPDAYGITDPEDMIARYGKAAHEYDRFAEYNKKISSQFINEYGVPNIGLGKPNNPMDWMIHGLRGLKGTAIDMRKQPDKLKEATEVLMDFLYPAVEKAFDSYDPTDDRYALFARVTSLAHTIMNPKQYEKFSWPFFKKFFEDVAARDWCAWVFFEGSIQHITDFLQDVPAGHFALLIEQDDPKAIQDKLPNFTIAGGFPTNMLQNESKEKCIDEAKKLIDSMGANGNFIFSTDKMMSFPSDGKGENLKAVVEFVKEYGKY